MTAWHASNRRTAMNDHCRSHKMCWQVSAHRIICDSEPNQRLSDVPLSHHHGPFIQQAPKEKWVAVDVEMRRSRAASIQISISVSSSLVYTSAVMYTKTCASEGQIFPNFAAISLAATSTSCNCLHGTGRRSRNWSIRHTVRTESRAGDCSLRHRPANRLGSSAPGVQLRLVIQTCAERLPWRAATTGVIGTLLGKCFITDF